MSEKSPYIPAPGEVLFATVDETLKDFKDLYFSGEFVESVKADVSVNNVTLPFEDYTRLLKRDALLTALEWRGVTTWIGYEEAKKRADDYS
ncbi:host RecBCD nuclease inhibitor [Rhizobium phage RL38J1]|uniref:Uncharacterized protein n=1 Tax=Rhizobium phage RL38J1 TaxID=2663232 RepID=A0A6B9J1A8_9CAUD|nr:host RecBCD nuclease inhibitor [Rhizobium phage RL38J1]QGZ14004.1 hypothetical protein RL38J1_148 [Rhizobium phage RL38J1]